MQLQPATAKGGQMIIAEVDPSKTIFTLALSAIGAVVAFFKWQQWKDKSIATTNANTAAGNSEEIRKLWGKIDEAEKREQKLQSDLNQARAEYRKLEGEHSEIKQQLSDSRGERKALTLRIETYHSDVTRLQRELDGSMADCKRLHEQNTKQAQQILSLQQRLGIRNDANGESH